jgi:hypothetical protein
MAVYLGLFAVMWKYAPPDEDEEESDDDCCSLLSAPATGGNADAGASANASVDGEFFCAGEKSAHLGKILAGLCGPLHRGTIGEFLHILRCLLIFFSVLWCLGKGNHIDRPFSDDPEKGGVMSGQPRSPSISHAHAHRNTSFDMRPTVGGSRAYDINSRHSSFASVHSTSSARKNSIAEVGIQISFH